MPLNEADTCRLSACSAQAGRYTVPKLQATGWETEPHRINEQDTFADGRIIVAGLLARGAQASRGGRRRPGKRADYILRYCPTWQEWEEMFRKMVRRPI